MNTLLNSNPIQKSHIIWRKPFIAWKKTVDTKVSASGIIIAADSKERTITSEVVAVGDGKQYENGNVIPTTVKVGEQVMYLKGTGIDIKIDGVDKELDGKDINIIIVEGLFVLYNESVRNTLDLKIFTLLDADICLARRIKRDQKERNSTHEEVVEHYQKYVKPSYVKYVIDFSGNTYNIVGYTETNSDGNVRLGVEGNIFSGTTGTTTSFLIRPMEKFIPKIHLDLNKDFANRILPAIGNEVLKTVLAQYDAEHLLKNREKISKEIRDVLVD